MRRPADPIRELAKLARVADHGLHNIGTFLREHAAELGPVLGVDDDVLQGVSDQPDHLLGPKIEHALRQIRERRAQDLAIRKNQVASAASRELAERATWTRDVALLDPTILLGNLLADDTRKYIAFDVDGKEVAVERSTLVATAKVLSRRPDVVASVDAGGVRIRWNGGCGGLNWRPQQVLPADRDQVLRVELVRQPELSYVPAPPPVPKRPSPRWSWDAFLEIALP